MGTQDVSRDELFQLLSSQRRRFALHACRTARTPVALSDLAQQVAAWEYGKDRDAVTAEERRRVYTSLQQTHLPALDEAGIVDVEDKQVSLADGADAFEVYLEIVPENSIPWGVYYLGLSIVSAAFLGLVAIGVYPDWIPDLAWAGLIVGVFAVSATVHIWRERKSRLGFGGAPPDVETD
jgi:hypothetical protein